ncbi:MAG TPA: hypothetical protein VFV92_11550, partial [Candidatus Bathyarchaeia archaeon]|nr:hypothetical protein [Candidatus Bathyarchaeia archaeon]
MTKSTPFIELAQLCQSVEATSKRTEKTELISSFLRKISIDEVQPTALFLAGRAFPESDPRVLEVSYATISEVGKNLGQKRLMDHPLTILEVFRTLGRIAETSGSRSRDKKTSLLQTLFTQASTVEAEYLVRMMLGEMRIGAVEGVLLDAISSASRVNKELIRRA